MLLLLFMGGALAQDRGRLFRGQAPPSPPPVIQMPRSEDLCMSKEDQDRIRVILLLAVDEALKDQVMHLFEVWMRDFKEQPERAAQGTRNAIYAYLRAREAVAVWNPQPCVK